MKRLLIVLLTVLTSFLYGQTDSTITLSKKEQRKKKKQEMFRDTLDGAIDLSGYLKENVGLLTVPIIITEPAVGLGGGLALTHFYENKKKKALVNRDGTRILPPNFTALAGFGTSNKTWGILAAHKGFVLNDKLRFTIGAGYTSLNMNFYIFDQLPDRALEINLKVIPIYFDIIGRIPKLPLFVGINYFYNHTEATFVSDTLQNIYQQIAETDGIYKSSGIGPRLVWEGRDNIMSPSKGIYFRANSISNFTWLGSTQNFTLVNAVFRYYKPLFNQHFFIGYNLSWQSAYGDVPFYSKPFIYMRGVPAARYQGKQMLLLDSEYRVKVYNRWSLVGFVGAGIASDDFSNPDKTSYAISGGGGFRYFLSRFYGIHGGMDFAGGRDGFAWYITVGSYWR